jgi:hypothetical protein
MYAKYGDDSISPCRKIDSNKSIRIPKSKKNFIACKTFVQFQILILVWEYHQPRVKNNLRVKFPSVSNRVETWVNVTYREENVASDNDTARSSNHKFQFVAAQTNNLRKRQDNCPVSRVHLPPNGHQWRAEYKHPRQGNRAYNQCNAKAL